MTTHTDTDKGHYAQVNGVNLYYETYGTGQPLVLLHGGLGTIDSLMAPILPPLAQTRQVIAVELQAHGHTADIERPMRFEHMADDVAALVQHLGLGNADLFGYSLGGGVALQTAIRHPDVVRKLVIMSAPCKRKGWYPESLAGMAAIDAEMMKRTPLYDAYARVAPKPEDWPVLISKTRTLLGEDYDWSAEVASLKTPTLIVVGDADSVRTAHAVEMYELLGGGQKDVGIGRPPANQLAILPGTTHLSIMLRTDLLPPIITSFLDVPMPASA